VIVKRPVYTLEKNGFDGNQFVYLKNCSCIQDVLCLAEIIKNNLLNGKFTGVLFFDLTDAFGSANRNKLLYKLSKDFGISGKLLLYLVDFLSSRYARVTVNELVGEWISSEWGTSAGTVLGAVLFISYVHDTPSCIQPKFADDFVCHTVGENVAMVIAGLQQGLAELVEWSIKLDTTLNVKQTKAMLFGRKVDEALNLSNLH